jgi:putative SOS response-associated peptidase YedK
MCGRFALPTPEVLAEHFKLRETPILEPRYNISPSQDIAVIRLHPETGTRELVLLRWGLIPFWAKDTKIGYKMINARADGIENKPSFRAAFKRRRCLVPALGFYEWDHKQKTNPPYFIRLKDSDLLAFAGLWEHWQGEGGEIIESCTIVTTEANGLVGTIHDRMPAIIEPGNYADWLTPQFEKDSLLALLQPLPEKKMLAYLVGKGVNNPKNDTLECLAEIKVN